MAPSTVYTRASTTLVVSSRPSVLRSLTSNNFKRCHNLPVRTLWWWSKHGTWSSTSDENLEDRLQRHQKIMRHRYSRALRRRAMWERDDGTSSWLWRSVADGRLGRKPGACRAASSTSPLKTRLDDKHESYPDHQKFWNATQKEYEKQGRNFERFKTEIDRAIERDPYGTLFGRRLQSPPTPNNSSWISWLLNIGEPLQESSTSTNKSSVGRKIEIEVLDKDGSPVSSEAIEKRNGKANSPAATSDPKIEYMYDPISGRKVPRQVAEDASGVESIQNFLGSLFSEHGATPDKHVKHHHVYGHSPRSVQEHSKSQSIKIDTTRSPEKGFESSRKREYQQLRASTIGNSIDTTAEYGGKFRTTSDDDTGTPLGRLRKMGEHEENVPLFSGTAYEYKSAESAQKSNVSTSRWLEEEGFRTRTGSSDTMGKPLETQASKLQPSFDRMQSDTEAAQERKFTQKLQPALDRSQLLKSSQDAEVIPLSPPRDDVQETTASTQNKVKTPPSSIPVKSQEEVEKREDVDLLRASDVRAAAREARTTKQEIMQAKMRRRSDLEDCFDKMSSSAVNESVSTAKQLREESARLQRSVPEHSNNDNVRTNNITKQVQVQQIDDRVHQMYMVEHGPIDLSLAQTPISTEAIQDKHGNAHQTAANDAEYSVARAKFLSDFNQLKEKVSGIRRDTSLLQTKLQKGEINESENLRDARVLWAQGSEALVQVNSMHEKYDSLQHNGNSKQTRLPHPLSTATVKPGVPQYPDIERHIKIFESKFAQLVQEAKTAKANIQNINAALHDLKRSRMSKAAGDVEIKKEYQMSKSKPELFPASMQNVPSSPYLLLVYNKTTGEVDQTSLDRLPWSPKEKIEKTNPIKIMGNLNYPAAFVTHFVELEKSGYVLSSGGGDMLVFEKHTDGAAGAPAGNAFKLGSSASKHLRNAVASEEALAQPEITETIAQPRNAVPKQAATVLDDIPVDIPPPGPAAPTAPPTNPLKKPTRPSPKVRRQEQVFSGTIPVRSAQGTKSSQQRTSKDDSNKRSSNNTTDTDPGFFARTTRTVKRGVLGVAAFGAAAYTIGMVAEGIGAQAQVDGDTVAGPRTKVVMPMGQRPGIYSTESSRAD